MVNLVLLLYNANVGEKYGRKMMHGVTKTKGINVGEIKIVKLSGEINPEVQSKRQNVVGNSLSTKYFDEKIR